MADNAKQVDMGGEDLIVNNIYLSYSSPFNRVSTAATTGLLYESATGGITAHSGGGKASATALTSELNRITTAAASSAPFDSVLMPAALAGLTICVINKGANPIQVFGQGSDTIDGVATGTGVTQMPSSMVIYSCTTAAAWDSEGLGTGYSGSLQTMSFANGLTAAGSSQGTALALANTINRLTTVAVGTGVLLPASAAGLEVVISNQGTNAVQVYGAGTDTINGIATATGLAQQPSSVVQYYCTVAGSWESSSQAGNVSARTFHTGGRCPTSGTDGTSGAPSATVTWVSEVFVPANCAVTGVAVVNGTVANGNTTIYLSDNQGNQVAHTASTAQTGTSAYQRVPFTAVYNAHGPATYYVVVQNSGATGTYLTHTVGNFGAASIGSTTYGTYPTVTVPTTFTTAVGPVATLY